MNIKYKNDKLLYISLRGGADLKGCSSNNQEGPLILDDSRISGDASRISTDREPCSQAKCISQYTGIPFIVRLLRADPIAFTHLKAQPPHHFRRWSVLILYWIGLFLTGFHGLILTVPLSQRPFLWDGVTSSVYSLLLGSLYIVFWFHFGSKWEYFANSTHSETRQYVRDIMSLALFPIIFGLFSLRGSFLILDALSHRPLLWYSSSLMNFPETILLLLPFWVWTFLIVTVGFSVLGTGEQPPRRIFGFLVKTGFYAAVLTWLHGVLPLWITVVFYYESPSTIARSVNFTVFYVIVPISLFLILREILISFSTAKHPITGMKRIIIDGPTSAQLIRVGSGLVFSGFYLLFSLGSSPLRLFFLAVGSSIVLAYTVNLPFHMHISGFKPKILKILLFSAILYSIPRGMMFLMRPIGPLWGESIILLILFLIIPLGAILSGIGLLTPKIRSKKRS